MKKCINWYPVFIMIAIDLAFAISNILLKKVVTDGMDHLVFITYRQSISTIFLSPLAFFLERKSRPKLTSSILCHLFLSAIAGASLTQYLFLVGIEYTSATFACAFVNMVPVVTFLMALPFRLESINLKYSSGRAKVIGTLVCLGGAILLTVYRGIPLVHFSGSQHVTQSIKLSSSKRSERWTIGSLAMLAGTFLWSSWFLLQANIGNRYPCQYSSTAIMTFFSAVQSALFSLSINRNHSIWYLDRKTDIIAVIYAGMVGSGLCIVGMSWCVKKRGPVFTAAFSPLVQIMAAMFDVPILHEQLHLGSLIGSITVMAGLYMLLWGKNKEMKNQEIKVVQSEETQETKEQEPQFQVIGITSES
ncbi:WAT1-related protein At4g01440-like isoform X2 [Olea europaea var. sylvestris]|uniref:WAT1-related protein At4g01440-like isoform X2 n=1 Tax=Olea europaea var. sylvestris TaxID=158386 RepID=UPI000C1D431A|nr:WAT1-related protein At4g01440-like isoform X2 [Olea europaea var. sylvestris]